MSCITNMSTKEKPTFTFGSVHYYYYLICGKCRAFITYNNNFFSTCSAFPFTISPWSMERLSNSFSKVSVEKTLTAKGAGWILYDWKLLRLSPETVEKQTSLISAVSIHSKAKKRKKKCHLRRSHANPYCDCPFCLQGSWICYSLYRVSLWVLSEYM